MAESVATGGLKSFTYGKNVTLKLDDERKRDIKEGYNEYYERKEREKRDRKRNWIILIIVILIVLILLGFWVFTR